MSWQATVPALIAATAALVGVALGALLEPLKLDAARRAQIRQERSQRCANLIEAAMSCRARLLSLNLAHRQVAAGVVLDGATEEERLEVYRSVRNELRQAIALLRLCGPDVLAEAAWAVREAESQLRNTRLVVEEDGVFNRDMPPRTVLDAAHALEDAVHRFAALARKH